MHTSLLTITRRGARARCRVFIRSPVRRSSTSVTHAKCSPRSVTPFNAAVTEVTLPESFATVAGDVLPHVRIRVESHGVPTLPTTRTVLIFPSFSHSSHVASNADDPSPGWWQEMVGPGKPIDTRRFRVICLSVLGSPTCPTNPAVTVNPATGKPFRAKFPQLTPTDAAVCHMKVLRAMGLCDPFHAVVGSSFGGMQALQFASLYPEQVHRVVAIACTGRTTPFTVGIRHMQRRAILRDPGYHGGDYADARSGPWEGLKLARELGTLFYRSREEFDARFEWAPSSSRHFTALDTWEVESYLAYQGAKFVHSYDPNAYLLLSKCMDLMDLGDGVDGRSTYAEGAARVRADTLLVAVRQDALIPAAEMAALETAINSHGGRARLEMMDSVYGHDAFLKEVAWLGPRVRAHLQDGLEAELQAEEVHNTGTNAP